MSALTIAIVALGSLCVVANAQYGGSCYWGECNSCCYCCGSYNQPYQTGFDTSYATSSASSSAGWTNPGYGGGVYYDALSVDDSKAITDTKAACQAFLEQYTDAIVQPKELVPTIQKTFYGSKALADQNKNGLNPSTFHCCMEKYGKQIYKKPVVGKYPKAQLPKDVTCESLEKDLFKNIKGQQNKSDKKQ